MRSFSVTTRCHRPDHLQTPGVDQSTRLHLLIAYNMHLPEPFILGIFPLAINRPVYTAVRRGGAHPARGGLTTFILFPAVPPWMAGWPLVEFKGEYLRPWIRRPKGYPGG